MAQALRVRNQQHHWHVREYMQLARTTPDARVWVKVARITNRAIVNNQVRIAQYDTLAGVRKPLAVEVPQLSLEGV